MICTEETAKTLWCCMARQSGNGETLYDGTALSNALCLASGCMMWTWTNIRGRVRDTGEEVPVEGYCGLSVKP